MDVSHNYNSNHPYIQIKNNSVIMYPRVYAIFYYLSLEKVC